MGECPVPPREDHLLLSPRSNSLCEILYETLQRVDFASEVMLEIPFFEDLYFKNFPGRECLGPLTEDHLLLSCWRVPFSEILYAPQVFLELIHSFPVDQELC